MHREGRLGSRAVARKAGKRSGEVRSGRASALSAEIVERHRAKIERAIVAGLESSSTTQRLKAAELALKIGLSGERIDSTERKAEIEHLDRRQLLDAITEKLTSGPTAALIGRHLAVQNGHDGDVIDGSELVTEITS
jgi:hypothetical protein